MADQPGQPHDEGRLIQEFCALANVPPEQARQFLEINDWDLQAAMETYFDHGQERDDAQEYESEPEPQPASSSAPKAKATKSSGPKSKLVTLGDLNRGSDEHDSGSENEDPEVQKDFFAGGEKSGLAVKNPKAADKAKSIINDLLKKSAQPAEREPQPGPSRSRFTGGGQTLGSDDTPSVLVPDPNQATQRNEVVTRTLTFWREGFSVEDGPLLRYDDPANQEVLQAIQSGRAPIHLMNLRPGQHADVHVYKRMEEDYVPPKKKVVPFSGKGNRLGSPAPEASAGSSSRPAAAAPAATTASPAPAPAAVEIDSSQPTTNIQVRLGDGSRSVSRFNHSHTVGDLYNYVNTVNPASASRNYVLQTTFPNKELRDNALTLKEAGLINAVVVQKWC